MQGLTCCSKSTILRANDDASQQSTQETEHVTEPPTLQSVPPPKPKIVKPDLDDLEKRADELIESLKKKYAETATKAQIEHASRNALRIWLKAAKENTLTGEAQLDETSGESSLERYFMRFIPNKYS